MFHSPNKNNTTIIKSVEGEMENPQAKRGRESPESSEEKTVKATNKKQKQQLIDQYWLGVPTKNRFEALTELTELNTNEEPIIPRLPRPPPIFIDDVENIQPLKLMLDQIAGDQYLMKILYDKKVKVMAKTSDKYTLIIKGLKDKKTKFYTYQPKQERTFRVVLRGLHHSTELTELKDEIEKEDHEIVNIWNIKQRTTKIPLPLFFVELKTKENNKEIYKKEYLMKSRIKFEPPHPKKEIPQCINCQEYGHTKKFCFKTPKCVKCAGDHPTTDCKRKVRNDEVKCVLCSGNHPANYKGCTIYKEIQKRKFPTLREKTISPPAKPMPSPYLPTKHMTTTTQDTNNGTMTYAMKLKSKPDETNDTQNISHINSAITKMENMMTTLIQNMNNMFIIINKLLNKLP